MAVPSSVHVDRHTSRTRDRSGLPIAATVSTSRRHDGQHRWSGSIPLANGEERVLHTSWGPNFPNGRNGRRNDDAVSAVLNAAPDPPVDYEVKGPDPDQWPVLPEADPAWLEKE